MSTQTVKICDVEGCKEVARHSLETVVVGYQADQGLEIVEYNNVDLCNQHEHQYRTGLPKLKLNDQK
jgi:hypothetical protein